MIGSRRPPRWRLVALLALAWSMAATSAFAESVRVKGGPAEIYERPRKGSDVVMVAPEGTVLEVLQREGDWYWVVLPRDANGTPRSGYIPVFAVERLGDKRVPEPGLAGSTSGAAMPAGLRPKVPAEEKPLPRVLIGLGAGGQFGSGNFQDHVDFLLYQSKGSFDASYKTPAGRAIDATIGVRLGQQFVLAFAFWRTTPLPVASVVAQVPHPLQSFRPRTATADNLVVDRDENDGHLQITYLVPISDHVDLSVFAGPSVFYLRQSLISTLVFRDIYPYDTVAIDGFYTVRKSKAVVGAHVGADLTVMLWRFVGVGVGGRYARGSLNLPSAGTGSIPIEVGGTQLSGGVRLRF